MLHLRKEIDDYSRACERLIVAAASNGAVPFTRDEIQWIAYYAKEMTSLVDKLLPDHKPQVKHERQTLQDYAQTSEALLVMKNLSNDERQSIRGSVSDVNENILDRKKEQ